MNKLDWATLVGLVITLPALTLAIALMQPALPKPPDFTKAEMNQRVIDYVTEHIASCKECGVHWSPEWKDHLEILCIHNLEARQRALTVGNWKLTWRGWMWIGKPYPNYEWSVKQQKWYRLVAAERKLKSS
jgi:hypothetical protein